MTYLLCEISQCVVITLNPGVGMGIINKFYYIIFNSQCTCSFCCINNWIHPAIIYKISNNLDLQNKSSARSL